MASFSLTGANAAAWQAGLLDSAMDGIISVDAAQNIVMYNRAAEHIFGWPASQVIGRPLPGKVHRAGPLRLCRSASRARTAATWRASAKPA